MDLFIFNFISEALAFFTDVSVEAVRRARSVPPVPHLLVRPTTIGGQDATETTGNDRDEEPTERVRGDLRPVISYPKMLAMLFLGLILARMVRVGLPRLDREEPSSYVIALLVPLVEGLLIWLLGNMGELQGSISFTLLGAFCVSPLYLISPTESDLDVITGLVAQSFFRITSGVRAHQ